MTSSRCARWRRSTPLRRRCCPAASRRARRCWRCCAAPTSPRAGPCSSSTTRSCSRARSAGPMQADAAVLALRADAVGDRGLDRRQRPSGRVRSARRRGRGRVRVRGQPRLRRRRAARADQLPELRQPREAARRLAADRGGRGARRRPARRSACRSSAATSRSTTRRRAVRSSRRPVVGMVGRAAGRGPRRAGSASLDEGDAIALVGPFAPPIAGSELAKLRGEAPAGPLPPIEQAAVREAARAGPRRRSAPGRSQRPRHRRGRARGGAGRVLHRRWDRRDGGAAATGLDLFARGARRGVRRLRASERPLAGLAE